MKNISSSEEIFNNMKKLVYNKQETSIKSKVAQALTCLTKAAASFEAAHQPQSAEQVDDMIQALANTLRK